MNELVAENAERIEWEEVADIFREFCVWQDEPEMRWFEEAWNGFSALGETSYSSDSDEHFVLTRAVTIGVMYIAFSCIAWDEEKDVESILLELEARKDLFNMVRIGNLASKGSLSDMGDETELFVQAMTNLIEQCRADVYRNLVKVFGNPDGLFSSLWLSKDFDTKVGDYSQSISVLMDKDISPGKLSAYEFVKDHHMAG